MGTSSPELVNFIIQAAFHFSHCTVFGYDSSTHCLLRKRDGVQLLHPIMAILVKMEIRDILLLGFVEGC